MAKRRRAIPQYGTVIMNGVEYTVAVDNFHKVSIEGIFGLQFHLPIGDFDGVSKP